MAELLSSIQERHLEVFEQDARVYVGGTGAPALLLLHGGWGAAQMHWSRVWNRLARRFKVVAPDLPGLGDPTHRGRGRLSDYVLWLDALLDALEVDKVVCVGNSFGGSLAWSFAGRSPDRCVGVVLVDGIPMPRTPAPLLWLGHSRAGRILMRSMLGSRSFTPKALPQAFANPAQAPDELRRGLADTPPVRLDTFVDCLIEGDGPPDPKAPVLILWGEADHLPGTNVEVGRELSAKTQGAKFVALSNAGHFPQLERAVEFTEALESFVEGLPSA